MKPCLKSLFSLVIALGLAVSTTGCFAQAGADADVDAIEALPESDTQSVEETDPTTDDSGTASPEDDETGSPDTDPTPDLDGLCTTPSCIEV